MKPVSRSFRTYALQNDKFAEGCFQLARGYQRTERYLMRSLRMPYEKEWITKERAIEMGGEMLSEGLLLAFASGIVIYEYGIKPSATDCLKARVKQLEERVEKLDQQTTRSPLDC